MLRLNPSIWKPGGEFEDGEAAISFLPDFISAMSGINTNPVHVHVGPDVGNEQDTSLERRGRKNISIGFGRYACVVGDARNLL